MPLPFIAFEQVMPGYRVFGVALEWDRVARDVTFRVAVWSRALALGIRF